MFRELNVSQQSHERRRRWFTDDKFIEIIVWFNADASFYGFQLCYGPKHSQSVLTWIRGHGFRHNAIEDGEEPAVYKRTPILVKDGVFDRAAVMRRFRENRRGLPRDIQEFVSGKLQEYLAAEIHA